MNLQPGIFGRKLGCTQIFLEDGSVSRVTVLEAGPVLLLAKRTPEKNGYTALVLRASGEQRKAREQAGNGLLQEGGRHAEAVRQRAEMRSGVHGTEIKTCAQTSPLGYSLK